MLDRSQIALKLGMDILDIPVCARNYRQICDAVYQAKQRGVYLTSERIEFDEKRGHAYSPRSHEYGGCPSTNLFTDVVNIEMISEQERKWLGGWKLDAKSIKLLLKLRKDLKR